MISLPVFTGIVLAFMVLVIVALFVGMIVGALIYERSFKSARR